MKAVAGPAAGVAKHIDALTPQAGEQQDVEGPPCEVLADPRNIGPLPQLAADFAHQGAGFELGFKKRYPLGLDLAVSLANGLLCHAL